CRNATKTVARGDCAGTTSLEGVPMSEVTQILNAIDQGDPSAAGRLLPLVYEELRKLAGGQLAQGKPGQTLEAPALVHEADLRLGGGEPAAQRTGRAHFSPAPAEATRRTLGDNARRKQRHRHGGGRQRQDLDPEAVAAPEPDEDLLALDAALHKLARRDPQKAKLIEL